MLPTQGGPSSPPRNGKAVWRVTGLSRWRVLNQCRLALPDVLAAGARNRLRGMFLCHRLPADGTILTPHIGSAFPQLARCNVGEHVILTDHCVEFFPLLKCCEKRERFSVSC